MLVFFIRNHVPVNKEFSQTIDNPILRTVVNKLLRVCISPPLFEQILNLLGICPFRSSLMYLYNRLCAIEVILLRILGLCELDNPKVGT